MRKALRIYLAILVGLFILSLLPFFFTLHKEAPSMQERWKALEESLERQKTSTYDWSLPKERWVIRTRPYVYPNQRGKALFVLLFDLLAFSAAGFIGYLILHRPKGGKDE